MRLIVTIAIAGLLAACGESGPVAEQAENGTDLPAFDQAAPSPTGGPPNASVSANNAVATTPQYGSIPAALQGRWGLSPGDCTSAQGDAKGLLTVGADELRFYESRAVPAGTVESDADSVSGNFAFTGEGQKWTKFQALEIQEDNLVRTERNPNASFTYARCG